MPDRNNLMTLHYESTLPNDGRHKLVAEALIAFAEADGDVARSLGVRSIVPREALALDDRVDHPQSVG
jgi:hypothetical protein